MAIFHAHYGLRGEDSEDDFRFVEELARTHDVPFFSRRVSAEEKDARRGESLQEWARRLRHEEFTRLAAEGWAIALGHHMDDLAETVLMRLARGTAPETLLGMRPWRPPFWRPFLQERKAAILTYMDRSGFAHREDASNERLDYSRNVLRHKVLPELEALFPGAAERIVACAAEAAEKDAANDEIARFLRQEVPEAPLSRRFVAATAARLSTGTEDKQGPELPGTSLRLTRQADGSLGTAPKASGIKADRARQHQRGIQSAFRPAALLEPGSYASFRRADQQWLLDTSLTKTPSHTSVRLRTLPTKAEHIPKAERAKWQILELEGSALGLYDGARLILPIDKGI